MPLELMLAWWNLIYIVPFALALVYLGLFVFTGITFGDADADVSPDMDADTTIHVEAHVAPDMDADVDADVDADADHDVDSSSQTALAHGSTPMPTGGLVTHLAHGASVDSGGGGGHSAFMNLLLLVGLGKIPVSLALMILMMSWGFVGVALNAILTHWLGASSLIGFITLPLTLVISLTLTGLVAALIAKIIPVDDETSESRQDLVGKPGEAMYDINDAFGMAKVRGNAGDFYQVPCRTAMGKPPIRKGARVVLFDYDRENSVFTVAPFDASTKTAG